MLILAPPHAKVMEGKKDIVTEQSKELTVDYNSLDQKAQDWEEVLS